MSHRLPLASPAHHKHRKVGSRLRPLRAETSQLGCDLLLPGLYTALLDTIGMGNQEGIEKVGGPGGIFRLTRAGMHARHARVYGLYIRDTECTNEEMEYEI